MEPVSKAEQSLVGRADQGKPGHFKAYKITHVASGRAYIGITTQTVRARWRGHLRWAAQKKRGCLADAIREYGGEAFVVEHVASAINWEALCLLEQSLIIQDHTFRDDGGYNLTFGGEGMLGYVVPEPIRSAHIARITGVPKTPECRAAISAAKKGVALSLETRRKMSIAQTGLKRPEEFKEKLSKFWKGRPRSPEHCEHIRLSKLGTTASEEARAKMSAARKGVPKPPRSAEWRAKMSEIAQNRVFTPETRAKMSAARRGRSMPPCSPEQRAKLSEAARGRKHSLETRARMSASHLKGARR